MVVFCAPPTGYLAHNPGICPDWELNWQCSGSQASTQSTESHQPGLDPGDSCTSIALDVEVTLPTEDHVPKVPAVYRREAAVDGVAQWIECQPVNQKAAHLIPSQGTFLSCGPGLQLGA